MADADGPRIRITADGPYRVSGAPPLARTAQVETEFGEPVDWEPLEPIAAGKRYALCRCGRSRTKPFCDDSHEERLRRDRGRRPRAASDPRRRSSRATGS